MTDDHWMHDAGIMSHGDGVVDRRPDMRAHQYKGQMSPLVDQQGLGEA
jgi:hypothetical protein